MKYWIGQLFGLIATAAGISVPVFDKKWQMLMMSIVNNACGALNLVFLDRIGSGIFLFAVAIVQISVNLVHELRNTTGKLAEKIIFLLLYLGLGFYGLVTGPGYEPGINSRNLLELLPIIAAMMNMLFVFSRREKTARIYYVICNFLWAVYHIIIGSTAALGTGFSVVSGMYALIKNRKKA